MAMRWTWTAALARHRHRIRLRPSHRFPVPKLFRLDPTRDGSPYSIGGARPEIPLRRAPKRRWRRCGDATLGRHGIANLIAAVGAMGKHLARIAGKASGPALPSLILADGTETSSTNPVSASAPRAP